jgi:hypothetical protein
MPSNISYLEIRDMNKTIIDYYYVGLLNYNFNKFSLEHFIYTPNNNQLYKEDIQIYDNKSSYSIWNNNTIKQIKKMLENKPITELEIETFEHTQKIINWIESKNIDYKNYHFLFITHRNI